MSEQAKTSLKLPIFLMVGPIAMIVISLFLYAIVNFVIGSFATESSIAPSISEGADIAQTEDAELFGNDGIFRTMANVLLFLLGAVGVLAIVPGLVSGIILLNKRKAARDESTSKPTNSSESRSWGDLE